MATIFSSPNVVKCLQVSPFCLVRSEMEREQCRSPTSWKWYNLSEIAQALFVVHVAGCCGKKKYFHTSCVDRNHWCQSVMCWWNMQRRRALISIAKDSLHGSGATAPKINLGRQIVTGWLWRRPSHKEKKFWKREKGNEEKKKKFFFSNPPHTFWVWPHSMTELERIVQFRQNLQTRVITVHCMSWEMLQVAPENVED